MTKHVGLRAAPNFTSFWNSLIRRDTALTDALSHGGVTRLDALCSDPGI